MKICIPKKAAKKQQRRTQKFMKTPAEFSGSMAVAVKRMLVLKMVAFRR